MTARFVAFEGIDGSGKTTQASLLARHAASRGITAIELEEPSRGPLGLRARAAVAGQTSDLEAQRELFTLDRRDQVERKVRPLLRFMGAHDGFMLILSRYYLSAPAYQTRGCETTVLLAALDEQRAFAPAPDLFVVLDVDPGTALERISAGRAATDAFETMSTLVDVRRRYAALRTLEPTPQVWIDAEAPVDDVHLRVVEAVFGAETR